MTTAQILVDCKNTLGEGPVWVEDEQKLYWVDIEQSRLWTYDPEAQEAHSLKTPERLCSFSFYGQGKILGAFSSQLAFFDLTSNNLTSIESFEKDTPSTRSNDGCCDSRGRFIFGGTDESGHGRKISNVYSVDGHGHLTPLIRNVACANSICFSPDNSLMYFADSPQKKILVYDYDLETGEIRNQRVFVDLEDQPGVPDGSTIDEDGFFMERSVGGASCDTIPAGRHHGPGNRAAGSKSVMRLLWQSRPECFVHHNRPF